MDDDPTTRDPVQRTTYEHGPRIGATADLRLGATAAILDGDRLLLTRRSDNGEWCMPGGAVDAGETPSEAAVREVFEETGLTVKVTALLAVHSNPDLVVIYPDGNRAQIAGVLFRAIRVTGDPGLSTEVTDFGWFTAPEAANLTVIPTQAHLLPLAYGTTPSPHFD